MKQQPIPQLVNRLPGRPSRFRGIQALGPRVRLQPVLRGLALILLLLVSTVVPAQEGGDGPAPLITDGKDSVKVQLPLIEMEVGLVLVRGDREIENYVPLVVSIFNRGHDLVRVRKDEFHLYGENGEELPLATVKQVRSGYRLYQQDAEIVKRSGFLSALPGEYRPTNFFPRPGSVGVYAVTLDYQQTFIDFLYFVGSWNQRLRLVAEGNKSRPTLEVQFKITRTGFQASAGE
jgi:hypothetical protein